MLPNDVILQFQGLGFLGARAFQQVLFDSVVCVMRTILIQSPPPPRALSFDMSSLDAKPKYRSRNQGKTRVQINDLYPAFRKNQGTDQGIQ